MKKKVLKTRKGVKTRSQKASGQFTKLPKNLFELDDSFKALVRELAKR